MLPVCINAPLLDLDPAESALVFGAIKQINSVSEKEFLGQSWIFAGKPAKSVVFLQCFRGKLRSFNQRDQLGCKRVG
jgi:hypothetical protein